MTKQASELEAQLLKDLDTKLWKTADQLRTNMDVVNYKHRVLGLLRKNT